MPHKKVKILKKKIKELMEKLQNMMSNPGAMSMADQVAMMEDPDFQLKRFSFHPLTKMFKRLS